MLSAFIPLPRIDSMVLEAKHDLLGIALTQLSVLMTAWTFYIVVKVRSTVALPDGAAGWVYHNPSDTTVIVTVAATIASGMTLSCFTRAAKHALRQYIGHRRSISLASLSAGVEAANAAFSFRRRPRHLSQVLITLIIATVFGLVNSAWTTFLSPVPINVIVPMNGRELDLGNQAFDSVLGADINNTFGFSNGKLVEEPNSAYSIVSFAYMAGATGAGVYATGQLNTLNFNNVTFNVSSGGILSAVMGYGGTSDMTPTSTSGMPAAFGGGPVPTILTARSRLSGLSTSYNITQQGLTANVSCYNYTNPADWYPIEVEAVPVYATLDMSGNVSGIVPVVNTTLPRMSCNRDIGEVGMTASIAAVNLNNSNFLGSVVCPFMWQDALDAQRIVVYHGGVGRYASVPPTICEIALVLTQSSVIYGNQLVTVTPQNGTAIPYQRNLNYWVALFIQQSDWSFQNSRVNSLGNMLVSLLDSGSTVFSGTPVQSCQEFLEVYWKTAIELMGTALRSGYTAYPQNVASMQIPVSGVQNISTVGWTFLGQGRDYALVPITLAAFMTFGAILLALYHIRRTERWEEEQNFGCTEDALSDSKMKRLVVPHSAHRSFDASNPVHLIVASAAQELDPKPQPAHGRRYWEQHEDTKVFFHLER